MSSIRIIPESIELLKMSDEEYFSDKYKDYVSNSSLSLLNEDEGGSYEKFLKGFDKKYSESFEFGSAVHSMVLQPEFYFISKCIKPTAKLGEFVNEVLSLRKSSNKLKIRDAINEASIKADYYVNKLTKNRLDSAIKSSIKYYLDRIRIVEDFENKTPIYISAPMKKKLSDCMSGISENPDFENKLRPKGLLENPKSFNEYAILCNVEVTLDDGYVAIIKMKAKLDNFTIDTENEIITLNDLKTTGKSVKFFMGNNIVEISEDGEKKTIWINGSFQKYHYYRQMAIYIWLLKAALSQYYMCDSFKLDANMLVVETIPNFKSQVLKVSGKYISAGLDEFKRLLIQLVECQRKN